MAKKKGGKKKSAKNAKPSWMSDEIFALTKDLHRLIEHYKGETTGPPLIDSNLAGMYIWKILYPSDKKTAAKRDEAIKLGLVESAVTVLSESEYKVTAVGLLSTLVKRPNGRDALFAAKPATRLALLLDSVAEGNICLASYTCRVLAELSVAADSKGRIMRAMQQWDWKPLVSLLKSRPVGSPLGGDRAVDDISILIDSLCTPDSTFDPSQPKGLSKQSCEELNFAAVRSGIVGELTQILGDKKVPNWCKVSAIRGIKALLKGSRSVEANEIFVRNRGQERVMDLLHNQFFSLPIKASIVECLYLSLSPSCVLSDRVSGENIYPSGHDFGFVKEKDVEVLLRLCLGPDGPLLDAPQEGPKAASKSKSKKGKGKKKAAKLQPGMAEAQTFATGVLRCFLTTDSIKCQIFNQDGVRFLAPLLMAKLHQPRWNSRQILLSLAVHPEFVAHTSKLNLPTYITNSNVSSFTLM